LSASLDIEATTVFERTVESRKPIIINVGGARSSKSYSIAQIFAVRFLSESNKKFLITRKTLPALKLTAYQVMTDMLKDTGLYRYMNHNHTDRIIRYRGNMMAFLSIDDPEKIKSTEWNYVWMEEANEFTWDDFVMLDTRMSAPNPDGINQTFLSLNPSDEMGWIHQRLEPQANRVDVVRSNYKDNPFLSESYINEKLLALKDQDEVFYKIYALGEWATPRGMIFTNWDIVADFPVCDAVVYGIDFGFNDPTTLIACGFKDGELFIDERLYESRLTNAEFMLRMDSLIPEEYAPIYADSADPQRIEEISRFTRKNGVRFNIHSAEKGAGSVRHGIDLMRRMKIHITQNSVNTIAEFRQYKWREDRNGNTLDEPVDYMNHAIDPIRYACSSRSKRTATVRIY